MARYLNRIATRMWLLAGLMTVITLSVGIASFYVASYYEFYRAREYMPPGIRAELDGLIASGQRGSDRYYEIYDRYSGDYLRSSDVPFLAAIALVSTLVGGSFAFVFARRISRPITAVTRAASLVASGDRSVRVDSEDATGETGELVDSFNRMANDIESYERERTVLTAGIAHELRTPLTILKGRLHGLVDGVIDPSAGEADRLLRQVEQLSRVVEDLRTLAHADAGELELDLRQISLDSVIANAVMDIKPAGTARSIGFSENYAQVKVKADALRLTQVFMNLLTNAIKHAPDGSLISVSVSQCPGWAIVTVADAGPGFRNEDQQKLFIPFWRAGANKTAGRPGSGMGLTLAAKLVEAHGGKIVAENRVDGPGAAFAVWLKSGQANSDGRPGRNSRRHAKSGSNR